MVFKRLLLFSALCGLLPLASFAQVMEVGLSAGAAGYMGDLNPNRPLDFSGVSFGAFVKGNLDPYWAVGLHYNYGRIKANDANSSNADFRNRNLNFSTPLNELSVQADFNFFDYFAGGGVKKFSPYIYTGLAGVMFNPKAKYDGRTYELRNYHTEGVNYKNYALSIPYGVGVKNRISDHLAVFTQIGYRTAFTDYLDDVGSKYPDPIQYGVIPFDPSKGPVPTGGSQRGDYIKKDTYLFLQIGISYTFISEKCFAF